MTKSILITGGAGFIGSHLAGAFLERGWKVSIIDNLSTGRLENVPSGARFYRADITDDESLDSIFAAERPEVINHHAAQTSVRFSTGDPGHDLRVNVLGTLNLITRGVRHGARLFVFASSGGALYGDGVDMPTPEDAPCRPASPYGVAKLGAEHYLEWAERSSGLPSIRLRYSNVYGPRQDPLGEAGVVAIFSHAMLAGKETVINGDGCQTRDSIYVRDVVQANVVAVESSLTGTYNIGCGRETDVNALFDVLAGLTAYRGVKTHGPAMPGEQLRSCLEARRFREATGWEPAAGLEEGLSMTVDSFRRKLEKRKHDTGRG